MAKEDGGAAFPTPPTTWDRIDVPPLPAREGMSLRDYFAAQALKGFMAVKMNEPDTTMFWNQVAIHCYEAADAMLTERAK